MKGNDNSYKCSSKTYPNAKCDNRGLSLPKLETFVLQYLQIKPHTIRAIKDLPIPHKLIDKNIELRIKKQTELNNLSKAIKILSNQLEVSSKIKEVIEKLESMQNKRQFLVDDIQILEKKITEEEIINPSSKVINDGRKKISMLSKINAEFSEIRKTLVFLL